MTTEFFTWYWFFSVIIVGLLINLISAYMKPAIDKFLERYSEKSKDRNEKKHLVRMAELNLLLTDPSRIVLITFRQLQAESRAYFMWIAMATIIIVEKIQRPSFLSFIALLVITLLVFTGWYFFLRAQELQRILNALDVIKKKQGTEELKKQQEEEAAELPF